MYMMWKIPFSLVKCCFQFFFLLGQKKNSKSVPAFCFDFLCPCLDVTGIKTRILLQLFSLLRQTWRCKPAHITAELSVPLSKVHWGDQTSLHLFMNSNSKYESQVSVNIKPTLLIYQVESNICLDEMYIFSEGTTDDIISFCFLLIFFKLVSCRIKAN